MAAEPQHTSKPDELRFATNDFPWFSAFLVVNLTEPETFSTNAKPWKSIYIYHLSTTACKWPLHPQGLFYTEKVSSPCFSSPFVSSV
uniref:SFRICE_003958 n=1 Tax=Spodoptera frugiperda TaxID=7108 RepID=A0A2H1WJM4_SPOFR